MTRLIDADALIEKYTVVIRKTADEKLKTEIAVLLKDIEEQPTIDAVRHGKWEPVSEGVKGGHFECCFCKHPAFYAEDGVEELTAFCPHCGARMDKDERD